MKTDENAATFRRKNFHEAADSGVLLWRENFGYFLPLFAAPLWICAFASRFFLPGKMFLFSWLIIWYLKPLFDRIALHIISVRFFERDANLKRLSKGLWKTLIRGLIGDLSWRRFSPQRSSIMPIRVLEKNLKPGKLTSKRKEHLKKGGVDYGFFLTIWGMCIETVLLLGEYLFFAVINELMLDGNIDMFDFAEIEIYLFAAWCLNIMVVETLYICMGFSLYINSRITVEGWDLEIIFRNFAEKIREKAKNTAVVVFLAVCLLVSALSHADDVQRENTDEFPFEELQKVLDSQDFGGKKESWGIRLKKEYDDKEDAGFDFSKLWEFFGKLREIFAGGLRILLVCLIAVFLVILIVCLRKIKLRKTNLYDSAAGIIKTKIADDPKTLIEKALNSDRHGDIRLAWGYCVAAAVQSWQIYRKIIFPPNATESDCSGIVNLKAADKAEAGAFNRLINNWIYFAYAGRLPPEGSFEEAVNFCAIMRKENEQ